MFEILSTCKGGGYRYCRPYPFLSSPQEFTHDAIPY